jgi:hypothetical protein
MEKTFKNSKLYEQMEKKIMKTWPFEEMKHKFKISVHLKD